MLKQAAFFLLVGCWASNSQALSQHDPMLALPDNLPPTLYVKIERLPILNARTGKIRFSPVLSGLNRSQLRNWLMTYNPDTLAFEARVALLNETTDPNTDGQSLVCDCENILQQDEFIVSEIPVFNQRKSKYISINDESYKAIMELIDYPHLNPQLITVSFSELAYLYNETALKIFLDEKDFDLIQARGFMNSVDYPGTMDTQYFLAKSRNTGIYFLSIRGTSGVSDLATSAKTALIPWGQLGSALSGFSAVANFIYGELKPVLDRQQIAGDSFYITGHSLGAAVAILLTIQLVDEQIPVQAITYASPPVGDLEFHQYYQNIVKQIITNYYLPNEELMQVDRLDTQRYLRTPGSKRLLQHVGTTANAAHFVINYLKSSLLKHKLSRQWYEASLPHCVLEKYNCFDKEVAAFVPTCALDNIDCFERAAEQVLGFHHVNPGAVVDYYREKSKTNLTIDPKVQLPLLLRAKKLELVEETLDKQQQALLIIQISIYNWLLNRTAEAKRFGDLSGNPFNW